MTEQQQGKQSEGKQKRKPNEEAQLITNPQALLEADQATQADQAAQSAQPEEGTPNQVTQAIQIVEQVRSSIQRIPSRAITVDGLRKAATRLERATQELERAVEREYIGPRQTPWRKLGRGYGRKIAGGVLGAGIILLSAGALIFGGRSCAEQSNVQQPQQGIEQPAEDAQWSWWPSPAISEIPRLQTQEIPLLEHDFTIGPYGFPLRVEGIPAGDQSRIVVEKITDDEKPYNGMNKITLSVVTSDLETAKKIPEQVEVVANMHGRIEEIQRGNPKFGTYVVLQNHGGFRVYIVVDEVLEEIKVGQIIYAGTGIGRINATYRQDTQGVVVEYPLTVLYYKNFNPNDGQLLNEKRVDLTTEENMGRYRPEVLVDWGYHAANPPKG